MQAIVSMNQAGFGISGILHVGANQGQERHDYAKTGASPCIYVEPIPEVFGILENNLEGLAGHIAVNALCSNVAGQEVVFNIANNSGLSSSMLPLGAHEEFHPEIQYSSSQMMTTTTVDQIIHDLNLVDAPNLLVIDTQGAELAVLMGAARTLESVDGIFVEVSELPLYEGGCSFRQLTDFLVPLGFRLRWLHLNINGHGDAFYCRPRLKVFDLPEYEGNIALKKVATQSSFSIYSKENDAAGAINGRKTGDYGFHTELEQNPWWQLDLLTSHDLNEIRVFNRIGVARGRAKSLRVSISSDNRQWNLVHDQSGRVFGGVDGRPLRIILGGVSARYIRLQLNDFTYLHLDEVEVY